MQVDRIKPTLKAPGTKRLRLEDEKLLSNSAFKFILRRYSTARDLDDALHAEMRSDGVLVVGVHIADVSHFIQAGSALDKVGRRRLTLSDPP